MATQSKQISFMQNLKQQKWLTLLGLPILLITSLNNIYSVWGVLFVYWGIVSIRSGQVYLLEPIEKDQDPALFWIITLMWITFGGMYVLADYFPQYFL